MIWKEVLEETQDMIPQPLIRRSFLEESASIIPDECFNLGRIVEIGAHRGGTTLRLAYLAKKYNLDKVVTIDIWEDNGTKQAKLENMDSDGLEYFLNGLKHNNLLEYVEYYKEDSKILGKKWNQDIGFIIFDGSHYYEDVKQDMLIWKKFLVNKAIIVIDDFGPWGETSGPEGAANEVFLASPFYKKLYHNNTFVVLQKK